MIANFFSKTKPINFLVLSILFALVYFIGNILLSSEGITFTIFIKKSFFLGLTILSVFIISFIIRKNYLTDDNSYAILIYIFLFGIFPYSLLNEKLLLSNFILLFAFRRIYSLRTPLKPKEKIFDSGFWIGIAGLLFYTSFWFLILLYLAIWFFKKQGWRNFIIPIIGVVTPVFIYGVYLSLYNDYSLLYLFNEFSYDLNFQFYQKKEVFVPILIILIVGIIAIFPTTTAHLSAKIDYKLTWLVLLTHLILSLVLVLISQNKNGEELVFVFFPLSILIANYVQIIKKQWIKELLLYVFLFLFVFALFSHS